MKKEEQNDSISTFNLIFWLGGVFYLGWILRQTIINLFRIQIDGVWYNENYALIQLITYLPFGLVLSKATKAKFSTLITALFTIFSLYIVSTSADMVVQLDNAWTYIKENTSDILDYLTNQVIWLLPILIGYSFTELVKIVMPKLLENEKFSSIFSKFLEVVNWIKNFWIDKINRLTKNSSTQTVKKSSTKVNKSKSKKKSTK